MDGTWKGLRHYTPSDPTFRQKLFLWRQFYDVRSEPQPEVTITGRRLDSFAPALLADQAANGWAQRDQPFMVVGINFPTLGCWEIKALWLTRILLTGYDFDDYAVSVDCSGKAGTAFLSSVGTVAFGDHIEAWTVKKITDRLLKWNHDCLVRA
jgi:hypothetical protein